MQEIKFNICDVQEYPHLEDGGEYEERIDLCLYGNLNIKKGNEFSYKKTSYKCTYSGYDHQNGVTDITGIKI